MICKNCGKPIVSVQDAYKGIKQEHKPHFPFTHADPQQTACISAQPKTKLQFVFRLSQSQQMAILDVIMEHMRLPEHTEVFINCSTDPATETTVAELLTLFADAGEMVETYEQ